MAVILIADDVLENIRLLKNLLQDIGQVVFAQNGLQALEQAKRHVPDIILLDVMMPELDGYETCRRLKAQPETRNIPIMFVTSNDGESDEEIGLGLGAIDYITKPFSPAIVRARVKNQLALARANAQASRFSADAAHELKTPLAILQGELEQSLQQTIPGSPLQCSLSGMMDEVRRLDGIVRKLLLLSRADAGRMLVPERPADLAPVLDELVEDISLMDPAREVRVSLPSKIVVRGDQDLLRQVLQNLISNAVKYGTPEGWIRIDATESAGRWLIDVANASLGIAAEHREHLFERFYRADAMHGRKIDGVGLGLALAREIARAHGGDLALHAADPGEVCFRFSVPALAC